MLMILARLVRSESFWAVAKVRSPHTGPGIRYIIELRVYPGAAHGMGHLSRRTSLPGRGAPFSARPTGGVGTPPPSMW